jgi:hypothetical protein
MTNATLSQNLEIATKYGISHVELHLSPALELKQSLRERIKNEGGRYSECRGYSMHRFVTLPLAAHALISHLVQLEVSHQSRMTKPKSVDMVFRQTASTSGRHQSLSAAVICVGTMVSFACALEKFVVNLDAAMVSGYIMSQENYEAKLAAQDQERTVYAASVARREKLATHGEAMLAMLKLVSASAKNGNPAPVSAIDDLVKLIEAK